MKKLIIFLLFSSRDRKRIWCGLNDLKKKVVASIDYYDMTKVEEYYDKLKSYFI